MLFGGLSRFCTEDIRAVTLPCLGHHLILKSEHVEKGLNPAEAVDHILSSVPIP